MEPPSKRQKISRIEARNVYYHNQRRQPRYEDRRLQPEQSKDLSLRSEFKPLSRPQKMKHEAESLESNRRRQAEVGIDTPIVEVEIKVQVDSQGNTLAVILPTVPAVPQFPSGFGVPAVPSVAPVTLPVVPSVPPYPFVTLNPTEPSAATTSPAANSTRSADVTGEAINSSAAPSNSVFSSPSSAPEATSTSSADASASSTSTELDSIGSSMQTSSRRISTPPVSETTATTLTGPASTIIQTDYGAPIGGSAIDAPPGAASTAGSGSQESGNSSDGDGPSTPTVVGGVVGGVAGLAVFLCLLLVLLRWYKRKQRGGALQLGESDAPEPGPSNMSEKGTLIPPAATALLSRYRFSAASKETDTSTGTGERSFQRVSGRKLPSAFSPGMTSDEVPGSSYRDSQDTYGGPSVPIVTMTSGLSSEKDKETMMPSPARTPVIHENPFSDNFATAGPRRHVSGASTLSPPQSPHRPDPRFSRGTLGRSHPSFDGSRGSKFTEDV